MRYSSASLVALACALLPHAGLAADADEEATANKADAIIVSARLDEAARSEQKSAPNLINIQAAESIAKYPDVNAAEAISRIPGVSLSIDTSEGRFVNIRGIDGNFDGATMGGVVLLNTQPGGTYFNAAGRAVEFDTVPIGAVDRIAVIKTGLPDHDAEGIGGSIELTPRTALHANRLFADVTLGGGIETFAGKGLYRDEVVLGGPIGGAGSPVSFVVSQFLYNDHRSFHDIEESYVDDTSKAPDKAYGALEMRKYDYYRQRFGYSGELDYAPDATQRYYLRASLAGYNEHVYRNRLEIDFNGNTATNPANANGLVADTVNPVKTLRDEDETHRNLVLQLGGDNQLGKLHVDYWGAYSRATYDKHFDYNSTFENANNYTLTYDNTTNPNYPTYAVTSGTGFTDPANYALTKIGNATEHDRDEEWSYALSGALPVGLAANDEVKIGVKQRWRHKVANSYAGTLDITNGASLSQYAGSSPITDFYRNGYNIGPMIAGQAMRDIFNASGTALTQVAGNYFDDNEDITAAFVQYKGDFGKLGVLAGLRFEHT
ncbi:MAG TPA: TonB-dependent receptor plug domain-containing protein, partial [Novosphingobium sp.]|nr:TonB-dependent receptor plug domain-containing protein [Novosphingobium sp.]